MFGALQNKDIVRFQLVDDRKATTLLPIISKWVEKGSTIVSDEWVAYRRLPENGYTHKTVCYKKEFVNRKNEFHTQ